MNPRQFPLACTLLLATLMCNTHARADAWITDLHGKVDQAGTSTVPFAPAEPYERLHTRTRIRIASNADATIQLDNGEKARWTGPVNLIVLSHEVVCQHEKDCEKRRSPISQAAGSSEMAETVQVSALMADFRTGKIAGIRMRGRDARTAYMNRAAESLSADDRHLLAATLREFEDSLNGSDQEFQATLRHTIVVLGKLEQYATLARLIKTSQKRLPGNALIEKLAEYQK